MYLMKTIVPINNSLDLPTCMYSMKNPMQDLSKDGIDLKISDQVLKFFKDTSNKNMMDIEERQDQLLKKLEKLYDQIKTISSSCKLNEIVPTNSQPGVQKLEVRLEEVVLVFNPDNFPWFLKAFFKANPSIHFTWHIHSSTPSNKIHKIQSFFESLNIEKSGNVPIVNLRLIFKNVSAPTELKISSLGIPIIGNVNVLRFLCEQYPNTASYNYNDYEIESLLDICHVLEKSSETQRPVLCKKFFHNIDKWIHGNQFSIVDLVLFNEVKQWHNAKKIVPNQWLLNCEKIMGY